MTPEDYNALRPGEAKRRARLLPKAAQLRLAVALSAARAPWGVGSTYNFWLRLWEEKPRPTAIVQECFL